MITKLWFANVGGEPALCLKNPKDPSFNPKDYDVLDSMIFPTLENEDDSILFCNVEELVYTICAWLGYSQPDALIRKLKSKL